jgi:hypothetical protein
VRERMYRGYCAHNPQALAAARMMRDKRPLLMADLASVPGLDRGGVTKASAFLDQFFAQIATDAAASANIAGRCVG